jgi:uncharacterized protein
MNDAFGRFKQRLESLKAATPRPKEMKPKTRGEVRLSPDWEQTGIFTYRREIKEAHHISMDDPDSILFDSNRIPLPEIVFFDLETTGLSGGAGTIAFLIGMATIDRNSTRLTQLFLSDYPGEADFLDQIQKLFTPEKTYVSYNGKGFDSHILKTRYIMHGREISFENQIDLLYLTRRFWKRAIGSCTLNEIETKVLGVKREHDMPGYLIPDAYFDFLRTGDAKQIRDIFEHNKTDIISLVELFAVIKELTTNGLECIAERGIPEFPIDKTALGAFHLERNRDIGLRLILESFGEGDYFAGKIAGLHYKKCREWGRAVSIWTKMWEMKKASWPGIELAKYYEHVARDYTLALDWVNKVEGLLFPRTEVERRAITKRIERIERKIAGVADLYNRNS